MNVFHRCSGAFRSAALGAAGLGLVLGLLGANVGIAGASPRHHRHHHGRRKEVVTNFTHYVGHQGKANRRLSPVTIGVVNQQTATDAPAPFWTTAVKLAVKYINQHTRGIDGHPLKAVYCAIPTTVSAAAKCGQTFANNSKIDAVVVGAVDVGNTALESALKPTKKPIFFDISLSPVDEQDREGFILAGTVTGVDTPEATFAKKYLHAKSVSVTYPSSTPADVDEARAVYDALKYVGIKHVYKVGFTAAETNLTAPFDAAHAATTTLMISITVGGPACSDTYLTLKSMGLTTKPTKKVLANGPCDTPTVAKADGGQLPHNWYYGSALPVSASTPGNVAFKRALAHYHHAATESNPWVIDAWGEILTVAKLDTEVLKSHKKITPATVTAKARAFKGPLLLGTPKLDCGGFPGKPAICTNLVAFYQNTAPGVLKTAAYYIGPPKGFKQSSTGG